MFFGVRPPSIITTREVRSVPRDQWERIVVSDLAAPCSEHNTIDPDSDAMHALAKMNPTGVSRLMVIEGGQLVGLIALKDLLRFISLKVELDEV